MLRSIFALPVALFVIACDTDDPPEQLELPGDRFYPESIHAAADGTIVVGSLGTGQIVRFSPGATTPIEVLAPSPAINVAGVLVDDGDNTVLACTGSVATFGEGNAVARYRLSDGMMIASYSLPDGAFCNDLGFDAARALYVADSIGGRVFRLAPDAPAGSPLLAWASHAALRGATAMDLGADGIVYDGRKGLYVNNVSTGQLVHIEIESNGEAGDAREIIVSPPLVGPDGMRALDEHTLIVAEGPANRVSLVTVTGSSAQRTTLSDDITEPASVVVIDDNAWAIEGQILRMFAVPPVAPELPFLVRRLPLQR
jgi:hypothetical protein